MEIKEDSANRWMDKLRLKRLMSLIMDKITDLEIRI